MSSGSARGDAHHAGRQMQTGCFVFDRESRERTFEGDVKSPLAADIVMRFPARGGTRDRAGRADRHRNSASLTRGAWRRKLHRQL